jgi:hypothetical protein
MCVIRVTMALCATATTAALCTVMFHFVVEELYAFITGIPTCSKFKKTGPALIYFGSFSTHFGGILQF